MSRFGFCALLLVGLVGCEGGSASKSTGPAGSASASASGSPVATGSGATAEGAVGATGGAGAAIAATGDVFFASLNGKPQKANTNPSETVRDAGGVFLGQPAGWKTDDTNRIDPSLGYGANLGGCLMFNAPATTAAGRTDGRSRLCAVQKEALPALSGRASDSLELHGFYINFDKAQWSPWVDGTVGDGLKAKLSKGVLKGKEAFAAYVEIPGRKPLLVVGRWVNDEEKESLSEIVRGIGSCSFTADKRKCNPDKPYR